MTTIIRASSIPIEARQPRPGVYGWFLAPERCLYVGRSDRRGTSARAGEELFKTVLSSDKGVSLDTNFIVGTAIDFYEERGFDVHWKHLSDNSQVEKPLRDELKPVLQNVVGRASILSALRLHRSPGYWGISRLQEATRALRCELERLGVE